MNKLKMYKLLVAFALLVGTNKVAIGSEQSNENIDYDSLVPGKVVGKDIFGLAVDYQNDPILVDSEPFIYKLPPTNITMERNDQVFIISLFDGVIGGVADGLADGGGNNVFGGAYVTTVREDKETLLDTYPVNFGEQQGVFRIHHAQKSPWGTVLFSEGGQLDSKNGDAFSALFSDFFKSQKEMVKPYAYGWLDELILLNDKGTTKIIKNYAAGRLFASSFLVMPDNKSFYFFDGEGSGNLYFFVSEESNSMPKGALYAVDSTDGKLVLLGKTSALKVKFKLKKASFDKIFDAVAVNEGHCPNGYSYISTVYGEECLKVLKKYKKYVGHLEPVRTAALKGVKPFAKSGMPISYDVHKNAILIDQDGATKSYELISNDSVGSEFAINRF